MRQSHPQALHVEASANMPHAEIPKHSSTTQAQPQSDVQSPSPWPAQESGVPAQAPSDSGPHVQPQDVHVPSTAKKSQL